MCEISIIIPVYNIEEYIDICLDSILLQTFKDFEVICVDDGSIDNSLEILKRYAKFDKRIKYIKSENEGCGFARNKGLLYAKGKYIMFVDGDDYISPIMLESMLEKSVKYDCDLVLSNLLQINPKTNEMMLLGLSETNKEYQEIKNKPFKARNVSPSIFFASMPTAFAKLHRKKYIKNLKFEKMTFEDNVYFTNCYFSANQIYYDPKAYYYYRIRPNSIISLRNEKFKEIFEIKKIQENCLKKFNMFEKYKTQFLLRKIKELLFRTFETQGEIQKEMLKLLVDEFKNMDYSNYNLEELKKDECFCVLQKIIQNNK